MSTLFPRNMQLIKKSRRMLSGIFHARPDSSDRTAPKKSRSSKTPLSSSRSSRRRKFKRRTSSSSSSSPSVAARRRTMDMLICRGEMEKKKMKRKREDRDDDDDDDWEFVQCKKRLVVKSVARVFAKEGIEREQVPCDGMPHPLPFHSEASDVELGELPDDYEELLEKVHSNLENLAITDTDDSFPTSITSTHQTSPEPRTAVLDWAWLEGVHDWENRYRARRCHSESSTRILSYANAVTGELPDGSGRRSAPPNLDTAWGLRSDLDRRASLGSVSALSEDGTLDGMLDESALELVLFAESEAGGHGKLGREEDVGVHVVGEDEEKEETQVGIEMEDAEVEATLEEIVAAAVAAAAEALLQVTTWQGAEATAIQLGQTTPEESQVVDGSEGGRAPESEPSSEPVLEQEREPWSAQTGPASPPVESISELTFRTKYDSLVNWCLDTTEVDLEPRVCQRQVTAEDVASRIRAVKEKMMESLLDIEQRLRPHCSGARARF